MAAQQNFKEELVGVFGHPVAENPTVVMLEAAFRELKLQWRYLTIEVLPQDLEAAVSGLKAFNMRGINLTIPHKVEVLKYLDEVKPDAGLMGAVNTVVNDNGRLIGENTDGKGFMRSLTEDAKTQPAGRNIVLLGAGGAARSISVELALSGARKITLVNRTAGRAAPLVQLLKENTQTRIDFVEWNGEYTVPDDTDIVINATSIGLFPHTSDKPDIQYSSLKPGMVVCDVIPAPMTPFLELAKGQGALTLDGLGMLVYQGAIGFKLWTGLDAPVEAMHKALSRVFAELG